LPVPGGGWERGIPAWKCHSPGLAELEPVQPELIEDRLQHASGDVPSLHGRTPISAVGNDPVGALATLGRQHGHAALPKSPKHPFLAPLWELLLIHADLSRDRRTWTYSRSRRCSVGRRGNTVGWEVRRTLVGPPVNVGRCCSQRPATRGDLRVKSCEAGGGFPTAPASWSWLLPGAPRQRRPFTDQGRPSTT
jgi:hypothetical protein